MAITTVNLIPSKYAESSQTTQYTATDVVSIIDKFTVTNITSGTNATITVNLVVLAATASDSNIVLDSQTVGYGDTYKCPELVGHVLQPGSFISTICSNSSTLVIRCSGREIS